MSEINLYPDQELFIDDIREELKKGTKNVLAVASTGFGKTIISAYIAQQAANRGKTVWFVCHLKNLLNQTTQAFWQLRIAHGLIASGKGRSPQLVQVATIGTLANRIDTLTPPDVLILDECHFSISPSWLKVVDKCKEHGTTIIGNSATPERLDGKGLGYIFDTMVEATPMLELIEDGRLSDYELYSSPSMVDFGSMRSQMGDFKTDDAEKAMDKPIITGDACDHWLKYANGLKSVAYCVSIKHSIHTAEAFNARGIPAAHVDGTTPQGELKRIINQLADGEIKVICNVGLMTTGFDLAAQVGRDVTLDCCILLRPTKSVALAMQMIGRVLRKKPYPAIILDHAGVCLGPFGHGLPDDERQWSLEGRSKGKKRGEQEEQDVDITECKKCHFVMRGKGHKECKKCGEPIEIQYRKVEEQAGELEKVERDKERLIAIKARKQEQGQAQTLEDLIRVGIERGIKKPAEHACIILAGRNKTKPTSLDFQNAKRALLTIREEP